MKNIKGHTKIRLKDSRENLEVTMQKVYSPPWKILNMDKKNSPPEINDKSDGRHHKMCGTTDDDTQQNSKS